MASRRAALASASVLRWSASFRSLVAVSPDSSTLQSGHRFANPGLSGFSSNSSEQIAQTLMGKAMATSIVINYRSFLLPILTLCRVPRRSMLLRSFQPQGKHVEHDAHVDGDDYKP